MSDSDDDNDIILKELSEAIARHDREAAIAIIEKQLLQWTKDDKKDIIYQIGHKLCSRNKFEQAEAWRALNKLIEYYQDPNSP
jgi:hypothetical protein